MGNFTPTGYSSGTSTNAAVAISTTSAEIVAAKPSRQSVLIQNAHASQILYVGTGTVTAANGIKLNAGEAIEFTDYNGAINGIASGAATDVRVLEVY